MRWIPRPIVSVEKENTWCDVNWHGGQAKIFEMGNIIEVQVAYKWKKPYGRHSKVRIWLEREEEDGSWKVIPGYDPLEKTYDGDNDDWKIDYINLLLPMNDRFVRFKVKVSAYVGGALPSSGDGASAEMMDPDQAGNWQIFIAYVDYFGDFSLDYLPVSIVYCPPGQDMYNALTQSSDYGTIISMGFSEEVGTKSGSTSSMHAGIGIKFGWVGSHDYDLTTSEGVETSDSVEEAMTNKLTLTYRWNTTLIADNQKVIGRRFWGPLGDIFLLLKNPWLSLIGDEEGNILLAESDYLKERTEVLVVQGNKLLRPDDDPIVSRIPYMTRKRILEMDPFYNNLDVFFPLYKEEGLTCYVSSTDDADHYPVYRAFIQGSQSYIYTVNRPEYEVIWPCYAGYQREGISFYIYSIHKPKPDKYVPLYWLAKGGVDIGTNDTVFTISEEECEELESQGFAPRYAVGYVLPPDAVGVPPHYVPLHRVYSEAMKIHHFVAKQEEWDALDKNPPPDELELAVNSYLDPSVNNRAAFIARYGISNGVEIDLSKAEGITVQDQNTTVNRTHCEVTESFGISSMTDLFLGAISYGISGSGYTGKFVNTSYHTSTENIVGKVKTALCKLVRNQNQLDLYDIEIFWDKHFSTFMFRKVSELGWIGGIIILGFIVVVNILIEAFLFTGIVEEHPGVYQNLCERFGIDPAVPDLAIEQLIDKIIGENYDIDPLIEKLPQSCVYRTCSNERGYYNIRNLKKGLYLLRTGDQMRKIVLTENDIKEKKCKSVNIENVKRIIDPNKFALWELMEILNIDLQTARKIQISIRKSHQQIDEKLFAEILAQEKLSFKKFSEKAIVKIQPERVRPGIHVIKGWVLDEKGKSLKHLDVVLLSSSLFNKEILEKLSNKEMLEKHPEFSPKKFTEFLENWPIVDFYTLEEALPPGSYCKTKTDSLGRFILRNNNFGEYHLIAGDCKKEVKITEQEIKNGTIKNINLDKVKRLIDFQKTSPWELRNTFYIPLYKAKSINEKLQKEEDLEEKTVNKILTGEKIKLDVIKGQVLFKIADKFREIK